MNNVISFLIINNKLYLKIFFIKIRIKNKRFNLFDIIDQLFLSFKVMKYCNVDIKIEYDINRFNYLTFIYFNNIGIILKNYVNNITSSLRVGNSFNYSISFKLKLLKYILKVS